MSDVQGEEDDSVSMSPCCRVLTQTTKPAIVLGVTNDLSVCRQFSFASSAFTLNRRSSVPENIGLVVLPDSSIDSDLVSILNPLVASGSSSQTQLFVVNFTSTRYILGYSANGAYWPFIYIYSCYISKDIKKWLVGKGAQVARVKQFVELEV